MGSGGFSSGIPDAKSGDCSRTWLCPIWLACMVHLQLLHDRHDLSPDHSPAQAGTMAVDCARGLAVRAEFNRRCAMRVAMLVDPAAGDHEP